MNQEIAIYRDLLADSKTRIRAAQHRALKQAMMQELLTGRKRLL